MSIVNRSNTGHSLRTTEPPDSTPTGQVTKAGTQAIAARNKEAQRRKMANAKLRNPPRQFRRFRLLETPTQEIHCQSLGESYRLVAVKATLHNNSKVLVRPHRAVCQLQQTSPTDDETVTAIYSDHIATNPTDADEYAWWNLGEVIRPWLQRELAIEPDERHPVTFEFIID